MKIIYAMSKSQKDIAADIEEGCDELIEHLIKLWFFPDSQDRHHWRREVAEKLHRISSFKGSHKLPSKQFILEHSIKVHNQYMLQYIKDIKRYYGKSENSASTVVMEHQIRKYFDWIAGELSRRPHVPFPEIYETLEVLGF